MSAPVPPKVYFPVESLVGLGHFNRAGKLVRELIKNGYDVTVASGSFVDPERFFAGAKLIEMPAYVFKGGANNHYKLDMNGKRTLVANFNAEACKESRTNIHLKNIAEIQPDIIITEFWPFDRPFFDQEMMAILKATPSALHIVSVRDVLNAPEGTLSPEERKHEVLLADERVDWIVETINNNYDTVLVHGDLEFLSLKETFPRLGEINTEITYTGYVTDDLPKRRITGAKNHAPLLVSCGSGIDGAELVFSMLTVWQKLLELRNKDNQAAFVTDRPLHIICGPRFPETPYMQEVSEWADMLQEKYGQKIIVERYRNDYTSVLAEAAFSVSLAGYNTTQETLAMGVPALFVPNYSVSNGDIKINSEQLYRLMRLKEAGFADYAHPDQVQNSKIFTALLIKTFIAQTSQSVDKPQLNYSGAENTVQTITKLLQKGTAQLRDLKNNSIPKKLTCK